MRRLSLALLSILLVAASCAENERSSSSSASSDRPADSRMNHDARLAASTAGMPEHKTIRPAEINWQDGPPSLPSGAQFAVLEGDPAKPGYFALRLKLPDGYTIPPHTHPTIERVTVLSGTFHLGMGTTFDKSAAEAMPAGTYAYMPPNMQHFAWAEGECILQLATMGPWAVNYVNPADDPRKK